MTNETKNPHPHADLIKAWADGATIQFYDEEDNEWLDCSHSTPSWRKTTLYRVKPEEQKQERWKPSYKERYFYIELGEDIQNTKWEGSYADYVRLELGNCFENRQGAITAYNRVEAALKGEEPKGEKVALLHPYLNGKPVSDGELALIRAIRKAGVVSTWERNSAVLIYEAAGDLVSHKGIIAFFTGGTDADDDEVRAALDAISQEQEAEQEAKTNQ